jgi:hypothetical protein
MLFLALEILSGQKQYKILMLKLPKNCLGWICNEKR